MERRTLGSMYSGIEHEIALRHIKLKGRRQFADFTNTPFDRFQAIVNDLPTHPEDVKTLRRGDLGVKGEQRAYVEGFERYDKIGNYLGTVPKGTELRTTPHPTIDGAVEELRESYTLFTAAAAKHGLETVATSTNPFEKGFQPNPPLNAWEEEHRSGPEDQTAYMHMITFGPDISVSFEGMAPKEMVDAARKLTYYSPFIVPFSFSAPFHGGDLWDGLSYRTFYRTGKRPATRVFLPDERNQIRSTPSLTQVARIPGEGGRIEFKALDTCTNADLYASLLTLMKGIILDKKLKGRRTTPDSNLHQQSAREGWDNKAIYDGTGRILAAARAALKGDPDLSKLDLLEAMHASKRTPAHDIIDRFTKSRNIMASLETGYSL